MDEYIKREDALDAVLFALVGTGLQSRAISAIIDVNTADVVPKSEVENIISNQRQRLNEYKTQIVTLQEKLDQDKAEGAIEAIEEIEREISKFGILPNNCAIVSIDTIAELKKKYQGGEPNG